MKHKDYEPIKFEIFQSDMEKIMFNLTGIKRHLEMDLEDFSDENVLTLKNTLVKILYDFQHKIDCHKDKGEWV